MFVLSSRDNYLLEIRKESSIKKLVILKKLD